MVFHRIHIRATSSIKSSLIEMSLRLDGTFTVISPFYFQCQILIAQKYQ